MIILAGTVLITLSNSGIISKANAAVEANDLAQVQNLATMLWADAYLDLEVERTVDALKAHIEKGLSDAKVVDDKYYLDVPLSGVEVRSIKVEDIDVLTNYYKKTYDVGKIGAYDNEVKYTWK